MLRDYSLYNKSLDELPQTRLLINTLNAHSYNVACADIDFATALKNSDVLIPDGISVVLAAKLLSAVSSKQQAVSNLRKIAGADLFYFEMKRLQQQAVSGPVNGMSKYSISSNKQAVRPKAMFLGSTEDVLQKIKERAGKEFPNVEVHIYSPPYKPEFSEEDNAAMYKAIDEVQPDVLFIGMTAPKQEKWAYKLVQSEKEVSSFEFRVPSSENEIVQSLEYDENEEVTSLEYGVLSEEKELKTQNSALSTPNSQLRTQNSSLRTHHSTLSANCHVCCIGAVFDFYAGTVKRAPQWMIGAGLEWFYRLIKEPERMWRRYLIGNVKFVWRIVGEVRSKK